MPDLEALARRANDEHVALCRTARYEIFPDLYVGYWILYPRYEISEYYNTVICGACHLSWDICHTWNCPPGLSNSSFHT